MPGYAHSQCFHVRYDINVLGRYHTFLVRYLLHPCPISVDLEIANARFGNYVSNFKRIRATSDLYMQVQVPLSVSAHLDRLTDLLLLAQQVSLSLSLCLSLFGGAHVRVLPPLLYFSSRTVDCVGRRIGRRTDGRTVKDGRTEGTEPGRDRPSAAGDDELSEPASMEQSRAGPSRQRGTAVRSVG